MSSNFFFGYMQSRLFEKLRNFLIISLLVLLNFIYKYLKESFLDLVRESYDYWTKIKEYGENGVDQQ